MILSKIKVHEKKTDRHFQNVAEKITEKIPEGMTGVYTLTNLIGGLTVRLEIFPWDLQFAVRHKKHKQIPQLFT